MIFLSVVAPVYNELRVTLEEFVRRVGDAARNISDSYEIILVDDGSVNDAWLTIEALSQRDSCVKGYRLARNYGQHVAITAGVDVAKGNWIVVMDSDLQDRPEIIPELYAKATEGFDVVFVNRALRPEKPLYRFFAACFYWTLNILSGQEYNRLQGNFSIISKNAAQAFCQLRESTRFYGGMMRWVGFRHTSITAQHGTRYAGPPAYNFRRRLAFATSLLVGFSTRLLYIAIFVGTVMAIVGIAMGCYIIVDALFLHPGRPVPGWPSVMTAVFFTAGITNIMIGLIGIYVGNIFLQTKGRPVYTTMQTTKSFLES